MGIKLDESSIDPSNEAYFDDLDADPHPNFDEQLIQAPVTVLARRVPIVFSPDDTVAAAVRAMRGQHRGCVLITEDGSRRSKMIGIFTERDVLFRVVDLGRDPEEVQLREVMVRDLETLPRTASVAWVLNKMSVGGFRHLPVVDEANCPVFVVSVRDVVEYLVEAFPSEVLNLPPEFGAQRYRTRDGA